MIWSIEKDFQKLKNLKVDGGASQNNLLMQYQADYLGIPVIRDNIVEKTALGAGWMAGLSVGLWKNTSDLYQSFQECKEFQPKLSKQQIDTRLKKWQAAVTKTFK